MADALDQSKLSKQLEAFFSQDVENGFFDVVFQLGNERLYAHKHMLAGISKPFTVMFSERWSIKDEPIKIESYSFNDFKEFLNVFYHSKPKLTDDNIFTMVDMAEFYDVSEMKMLCDEFLSKMEITPDNVFQMYEFLQKYPSLSKARLSTNSFMNENLSTLVKSHDFLKFKKKIIKAMVELEQLDSNEEDLFEAVYKWGEHQAIVKRGSAENEAFVLNHAIKEELTEIIPKICFERMDLDFLHKFVVPKGFLFSSLQDLSDILVCAKRKGFFVKVIDSNGKGLSGKVSCDSSVLYDIYDTITSAKDSKSNSRPTRNGNYYQYWTAKKTHPSKPNQLKKNNNVKYYLILDADNNLAVKKSSELIGGNYLIAELNVDDGFELIDGCKIEAVRNF